MQLGRLRGRCHRFQSQRILLVVCFCCMQTFKLLAGKAYCLSISCRAIVTCTLSHLSQYPGCQRLRLTRFRRRNGQISSFALHKNNQKNHHEMRLSNTKYTKMSLRPGLRPDHHSRACLQRSPDPLAGLTYDHSSENVVLSSDISWLVGRPLCGAPVRPNMLNMPKSASESVQ